MSRHVDFSFLRAVRSKKGPSTADARTIATLLGLHADHGSCHLDRPQISEETKLGRRRVRAACALLIAEGWATEEHGKGKPKWTLHVPAERPAEVETGQASESEPVKLAPVRVSKPVRLGGRNRSGLEVETGQATPSGSTPQRTPVDLPHQISDQSLVEDQKLIPPVGVAAASGKPKGRSQPAQAALPGLADVAASVALDPLQRADVTEVLEHWRSRGYHPRPVADLPDRRKRILDRLAEGLDVGTLKAAIDGASIDDWLMGRHERNDVSNGGKVYKGLETILRDAAQVEKLATLWDVALAEGRVLEDGGDLHYDRFGQPRSGKRMAVPEPAPADAGEIVGREEAERRFAEYARQDAERARQKLEAEETSRCENQRRLIETGTPEVVAENRWLFEIQQRSQARMAALEARAS